MLNTDYQLRENLIELLDHKIIEEVSADSKNKKGYTMMHYEKKFLEFVINEQEE